jgi:hypothetical protein
MLMSGGLLAFDIQRSRCSEHLKLLFVEIDLVGMKSSVFGVAIVCLAGLQSDFVIVSQGGSQGLELVLGKNEGVDMLVDHVGDRRMVGLRILRLRRKIENG